MYADYGKCWINVKFLQPELLIFSLSFACRCCFKKLRFPSHRKILALFCTRSKGSRSLLLCAISYYCKAHAWPAAVSIETRW